MCSCVFLSGRTPESVLATDLNFFPIRYARLHIDRDSRSVTASLLGFSPRRAVYREGLGCTLTLNRTEEELRKQAAGFAPPPLPGRTDTLFWPEGERLPDTLPPGVDGARLSRAIDGAFAGATAFTRAVVVVHRGRLVGEAYAAGFDPQTPQLGWSMTKSVTGALIGILVGEGRLDLDQTFTFPGWQNDQRQAITLDQLLRMSSGLEWNEAYGNLSDATRMLYRTPDMASYAIDRRPAAAPGAAWVYASGTTNLLSFLIRREIGNLHDYWAFPRRALFDRIGMRSAIIEPDADGTLVGSSNGYATPRDWARFGLLYLNDGVWQGERILPPGWVDYSRTPAPASGGEYGAHFWLNQSGTLPDVPRDMYACQGFQGQRVFIIPSRQAVVVRMGVTHDERTFDFNRFLADILAGLPEETEKPENQNLPN